MTLYHPPLIKINIAHVPVQLHEVSVGLSSATDPKNLRGKRPIACSGKPKLSMTLYNIMQDYESFSQERGVLELWEGINSIQACRVLPTLIGSGRQSTPPLGYFTTTQACFTTIHTR